MLWRKRCKVYISIYNIELTVNGRNVEEAREIWAVQFDGGHSTHYGQSIEEMSFDYIAISNAEEENEGDWIMGSSI